MFTQLSSLEIGGTKGSMLTVEVRDVSESFARSFQRFKEVQYDILDVGAKKFEEDYYEFRVSMKELEKRLGSIMTKGIEDCSTLTSTFKLIESFSNMLEREALQQDLDKKHSDIVQAYKKDLQIVQSVFQSQKASPPAYLNLPPTAGALMWCQGLIDRAAEPIRKFQEIDKAILQSAEGKEALSLHDSLVASVNEYQNAKYAEWASQVGSVTEEKLQQPLLARDDKNLLVVNFDPALVRLLREVNYIEKMNMTRNTDAKYKVPEEALFIFSNVEVYRTQTGSMEMIVNTYNKMQMSLLPVEKPLLVNQLAEIDAVLEKGVTEINWKSATIEEFLVNTSNLVTGANTTVQSLKTNVEEIENVLKKWERFPLFDRKETRTLSLKEFDSRYREYKNSREADMKKGSEIIVKKLSESYQSLKSVEKESEAWQRYQAHVNQIVVSGLSQCVVVSLEALRDQLDKAFIAKHELSPMIEIQLRLEREGDKSKAQFYPRLNEGAELTDGLFSCIKSWISDIIGACNVVPKLDSSSGDYMQEISKKKVITDLVASIHSLFKQNSEQCNKFMEFFTAFNYLWETNRTAAFKKFLEENASVYKNFDTEMTKYEKLLQNITDLPQLETINWLKVDSRPLKQDLKTICDSWRLMFVEFLQKKIVSNLAELYDFMDNVREGIDKEVKAGDLTTLKEVIGYIRSMRVKVESSKSDSDSASIFENLKEIATLLRSHGTSLDDDMIAKLENGPELWSELWKKSLARRGQLGVEQDKQAKKVKEIVVEFSKKVMAFRNTFEAIPAFFWKSGPDSAYESLDEFNVKLITIEAEAADLVNEQELFELAVVEYTSLIECREDVQMLKTVWDMSGHVLSMFKDWMKTPFIKADVDYLVEEAKQLKKRIQAFPARAKGWNCFKGLFDTVQNMLTSLPLVQDLRSPSMRDRHWNELLREAHKTGSIKPNDESFDLAQLIDLGLHEHVETVQTIVEKANKELSIEKKLNAIEGQWANMAFTFTTNDELKCTVLGSVDDIIEVLEDNQVNLQNLAGMRFVDFFVEKVGKWQTLLGNVDTIINLWIEVQKTWSNLYPIFVMSEDIRQQLPEDSKRFEGVDKIWRNLMTVAVEVPKVIEACTEDSIQKKLNSVDNFYKILSSNQENLEKCEKSLADYLETKRRAFPRFYFVAPADLVYILSKGSFPHQVMKHMTKLVEAINSLSFQGESNMALSMTSNEDELVKFTNPYFCRGAVETWLNGVLETIRQTLASILHDAHSSIVELHESRDAWLMNYPAQIVVVASRIIYTSEVNTAFERQEEGNKSALKDYNKQQVEQLAKLTQLVQSPLSSGDRKKIITLITVDVHNRDIVEKLVNEKAENAQVFTWQSQLRYSLDEKRGCIINIADAEFKYNYEYIGNCGCLVITPLTDRCYITLTQSLRLIMGGAPAGPAGTGKTETTKDLGRALGIAVYVFNCTEQMDYLSLGNIFKGLSMTGTWGCFDEFNRVKIGVLSVVATQFKSILDAIRAKKERFLFQNTEISLIPTCGAFITMNPGYKGRTELPENLKALFRPCAMVVPDFLNICEIMLASEGFVEAKMLSKKFVTLYQLNKELLSKKDHYDWGLRAVKSVLVIAGGLKRAEPDISEDKILMRALRDTNLAKLSKDDIAIFKRLIGDLFPNLEVSPKLDPKLEEYVKKATTELKLQYGDNGIFVKKVIQFKELLDVRHSVFVLGPAGSGKSCVWKALSAALQLMDNKTWVDVLDPKAVTSFELYGFVHPSTREWKEGLLSNIMREMSKVKTKTPKWIVLDGDIDAEWIESMNTVMDDNKVLTLASNERIPLTPSMRMVFEISHLKNATPATVSRAGILFLNETDIGWTPFKESWIEQRGDHDKDKEKESLDRLFEKYVPPTLEWIRKNMIKHIVPISDFNMITTLCYLLEGLITDETCPKGTSNDVYEHYFVFACIWAFGGALLTDLQNDYKSIFNNFWRKTFQAVKFPETGSIFDYFIGKEGNKLELWTDVVPKHIHEDDKSFNEIQVPTADTVRLTHIMNLLSERKRPVMLVGTAGTGKTAIIKQKLQKLNNEETLFTTINLNSMTDSKSLQAIMEQSIEKKSGKRFGPPGRKKLIFFADDLNMPNPDKYGTQSAISLLRQHIDYGYWYDRVKMTQKEVTNVQYLAAMNPKAGSFTVDDRLQRHFGIFAVNFPSGADIQLIYSQILGAHFKYFDTSIQNLTQNMVKATIELHHKVSKSFLPTAIKFHYQFNLRELANIFQGVCLSKPQFYKDSTSILKLWIHESYRVFSDRLLYEDAPTFTVIMREMVKKYFETDNMDNITGTSPLVFVNFLKQDDTGENSYTCADNFVELKDTLDKKLDEYNAEKAVMNLELFEQAMQHVCRISRIIFNPKGNALLVGVGGSGKQSLARLASFINQYEIFQITVTSNYSMMDFKNSLITLYRNTGVKGIDYSFLMTDSQIVHERMLVYINDLLSSGFIPELYTQDEKDGIVNEITNEVKTAGRDYSNPRVCWEYFIEKVRNKLHVILCFSPVGDQFRVWCRKFPAVINCTVIDWFHAWPKDALISVAQRFLKDIDLGGDEMRTKISNHMAFVHGSVSDASVKFGKVERRYNYVTPKSFLELIEVYKELLRKKREALNEQIDRLSMGLTKLKEASSKVRELQENLRREQVVVEEKKIATDELVKKVGKETNIVEEQNKIAEGEEEKTNKLVKEVEEVKAQCQEELDKAEPVVQQAMQALNSLHKKDIQELKSFTAPAPEVVDVTSAVIILTAKGSIPKNPTWNDAKKIMQNPQVFLDTLINFDKENIPQANIDGVDPYLKKEEFVGKKVESKSFAAAGLCDWVVNIVKFFRLNKDVEPKRQRLKEASDRLDASKASLKKVQDKVKELKNRLQALTNEYEGARAEKVRIEEQAKKTADMLDLAERLVGGLKDENVRWAESINQLKIREATLVGDVLLAAAFLSYVGAFTKQYRKQLIDTQWIPDLNERKIPTTKDIDPLFGVLTDEAQVAQWNNEGLPSDRVSVENGAIVSNCKRWPLLIDPQLQGIKWLKNKEQKNNLKIVQLNQPKYLDIIENAIENGYPVIIQNIGESIDSVLEPVLSRSFFKRGRSTFIKLGDKEVQYDPKFRLYLQTKMSNPHYRPEIVAQSTLLNFMVTEAGLEDQLLAVVVNQEKPELEEMREKLLRDMNQFKIDIKQCEDDLLQELAKSEGDILQNKALIENLENTKKKATQIMISVKESIVTSEKIEKNRLVYTPVAVRGSMVFFLMDQLATIDHMYQYSLEAFNVVFNKALFKATPADSIKGRVDNIIDSITSILFSYVTRGLFERHKLIFSTMLCFGVLRKNKELDPIMLDYLLKGPKQFGTDRPETVQGWCSDASWAAVQALTPIEGTTPAFSTLPAEMTGSYRRWKEWCEFEKPEEKPLPSEWRTLDSFQRLLIIRALRPDRLTMALSKFVEEKIGKKYVDDAPIDLSVSYQDAGPITPIFFILSAGVDPVKSVENLGEKNGILDKSSNTLKNVSLGQGQEPIAEDALELAFKTGTWVMLNNLHLTPEWLPTLEKKLDQYSEFFLKKAKLKKKVKPVSKPTEPTPENGDKPAEETATATEPAQAAAEPEPEEPSKGEGSENLRVFLSAEPSPKIPLGILQRSIKLTNEPPRGLRANMQRAIMNFSEATWENSSKQTEFKAVLFALCFFHAAIVERKKFGPQGWNRNYPFNLGDLTTCVAVCNNYLEDRPKVPWEDLRYVFGEIMYGGHITDDLDRRLCSTYLAEYIKQEIVEGITLCSGLTSPPPSFSYPQYLTFIESGLPPESPLNYGLHSNAEIGFRTAQGEYLFKTIVEMQPRTGGDGETQSASDVVKIKIEEILKNLPEQHPLQEIADRLDEDRTPYQNTFYQEIEYMNVLLKRVQMSLEELQLGLNGDLTISDKMQELMDSIYANKLPEQWQAVAYPSLRPLDSWLSDLTARNVQLQAWQADLATPKVVWLSGFFNPQSFLTAIMQSTARKNGWALDKMALVAEPSKKYAIDEVESAAREGAFVHGLFLEGASWDAKKNVVVESKMKELYPKMPIMHIKAIQADKAESSQGFYDCPMYKTQERGPNFVITFKLKTAEPSSKWILGGVAILLDVVE